MKTAEKKPKILLVDDMPSNLRMLTTILAREYQLFIASNGPDALELAVMNQVDLVLLDLLMPGMDGFEVCKRLQLSPVTRGIPVIFVTARHDVADETAALAMGAVDFIHKPVTPSVVEARVRSHLGLKFARETLEEQSKRLEIQNLELQRAEKMRKEVDHIMRHDLKAPLDTIIGYADLLADSLQMDVEQEKILNMVIDSAYALRSMIDLSADIFKMEEGRYILQESAVDMLALIFKIGESNRRGLQVKGATLAVTLNGRPAELSDRCLVLGEELLCFSMMSNLIKNAVEATPPGQAIAVSLLHDGLVQIRIHNVGSVPEEIREKFFEKYATFGKKNGTGLGAYSARLMATVQHGSMQMQSSDAEGTTITVCLPVPIGESTARP